MLLTAVLLNLCPYHNQTLKTNFSKTSRQKLRVKVYFDRAMLALSEYNFIFKFCRKVFEKLAFKVWLGYGTKTSSGIQLNCLKSEHIIIQPWNLTRSDISVSKVLEFYKTKSWLYNLTFNKQFKLLRKFNAKQKSRS